jgi:hypothetical protein
MVPVVPLFPVDPAVVVVAAGSEGVPAVPVLRMRKAVRSVLAPAARVVVADSVVARKAVPVAASIVRSRLRLPPAPVRPPRQLRQLPLVAPSKRTLSV